jgi:regulator of telomere elongation helicase 1
MGGLSKTAPEQGQADDFYIFITDEEEKFQNRKSQNRKGKHKGMQCVFGFWCFNAGVGFKSLKSLHPRSVILTSGTLSPLKSFEAELQMDFKNKLENPHVISPRQVNISILKQGISNNEFKFDYSSRDNCEMIVDLGLTIARVVEKNSRWSSYIFPLLQTIE